MTTTVARMDATFSFSSELTEWDARDDISMALVSVPIDISEDIRDMELPRRGFGSVPVRVRLGTSEWRTSIFPSKTGEYVLPVKQPVRKKEKIGLGDVGNFEIDISPE
ncbi:MAG: DUF1905 domain-containing protein [Acidimicrobiales bacterium]